jgi:hypothetical protein
MVFSEFRQGILNLDEEILAGGSGQRSAALAGFDRQGAGAEGAEDEQAAGDDQVLLEHQDLDVGVHAVEALGRDVVEEHAGDHGEGGERPGGGAGLPADEDGEAAEDFEREGGDGEEARQAV